MGQGAGEGGQEWGAPTRTATAFMLLDQNRRETDPRARAGQRGSWGSTPSWVPVGQQPHPSGWCGTMNGLPPAPLMLGEGTADSLRTAALLLGGVPVRRRCRRHGGGRSRLVSWACCTAHPPECRARPPSGPEVGRTRPRLQGSAVSRVTWVRAFKGCEDPAPRVCGKAGPRPAVLAPDPALSVLYDLEVT